MDNSKEYEEKRQKAETAKRAKEQVKLLIKLRRKYFFDRVLLIGPDASDSAWDAYLLEHQDNMLGPQSDSEFEAKLREAGLL